MRIQVAPGVALAGDVVGTAGQDVLLVHGWMMSSGVFDLVLPALSNASRRLGVVDLRGAGASDKPGDDYGILRHVADLSAWIAGSGLRRPWVVGHSMGGLIAQVLAARHPDHVAGLVLLNPVPASGLTLPADARALFASSAGDPEKQGVILDLACRTLPSSERARLVDLAGRVAPAAIVQGLDAWTAGGFASDLARITAPTHVVATSDPFLPAAFLQDKVVDPIRGACLHLLEGPGHYPQVEAPERTVALLDRLLP